MVEQRSEEAHRKVVHAAIRLFAKQGIDATSMDSIADTSGVSKATIYKHWEDSKTLSRWRRFHIFTALMKNCRSSLPAICARI